MPHETTLIATIVGGLCVAFALGALAQKLKISPLVGYLLAGIIVGPFTPGYVADQGVANELAEIGVILLMFGVGLHFSLKELLSVRRIAIPGAVAQIATATLLGMGLAAMLGWSMSAGFMLGLSLSVASTVVLLRALQERRILQTERGRIAVGWLIVEDLAMIMTLVLLPALAGALGAEGGGLAGGRWLMPLFITLAKVAAFVALMLIVGRRVIPWILHWVAHTGSRELFRLAVLAIALGVAFGAAQLFGVSFALGAFFAGMVLAESELSHQAAEETLPLKDAFAVIFFVSVGMLFDPRVVMRDPWALLGVLGVIVVGKSAAALVIMRLFSRSKETSLTVAASLAQIGEFSFILAELGVELGLLPKEGRDLILAGAIFSIMLNPVVFGLAARLAVPKPSADETGDLVPTTLTEHAVLVGFGRVGEVVAKGLDLAGAPFVLIEAQDDKVAEAKAAGYPVIVGNAAEARVLAAANIGKAQRLFVAIPSAFEAGQIVQQARRSNAGLEIIARAHSDAEVEHLSDLGANTVIMGEREIAGRMLTRIEIEPLHTPPEPPSPEAARPLILDDAQYAMLGALEELTQGAHATASRRAAIERAELAGFDADRLDTAFEALKMDGFVLDLGEDVVSLTPAGAAAASQRVTRFI